MSVYYDNLTITEHDLELLRKLTNTEYAKEKDITRNRAFWLRKKFASDTDSKILNKENLKQTKSDKIKKFYNLILELIKINPHDLSTIKVLGKLKSRNNKIITRELIEKVAKENNIEISFKIDNIKESHGLYCIRKPIKCNCDIYRLAKCIQVCFYRKRIKITKIQCDFFAKKYIDVYKKDISPNRRVFFAMIKDELNAWNSKESFVDRFDTTYNVTT